MRKFDLIFPLILLFACSKQNEQSTIDEKDSAKTERSEYPKENLQDKLIALYSPYVKFPLKLSTLNGQDNPEASDFEFRGNKIPRNLEFYFKSTPWYWEGMDYSFYAVYQFEVNKNILALITRSPGEYWESKLVIFLFDTKQDKIIKGLEVAETFGDAGDVFTLEAILKKENNNFKIEINQEECHPINEDLDNIECVDSLKVYEIGGFNFKQIESKKLEERKL